MNRVPHKERPRLPPSPPAEPTELLHAGSGWPGLFVPFVPGAAAGALLLIVAFFWG
ncbi:hypothetical protein [Bosea lathyri]|uniref:Uncharacterized protein n=1 Tax=Bosea lathyri TaxID=1036778 RepID=A0A1H6BDW2_9HYPH|nr:hypothetical protein [Bosea lathyri]SEG58862.1 hypothetical protein SAMN04488115_107158 [Bosea lathyri]